MRLSSQQQQFNNKMQNSNFTCCPTNPPYSGGTDLNYMGGSDQYQSTITPTLPTTGGKFNPHLHLLQAEQQRNLIPFPSNPILERINLLLNPNNAIHRNHPLLMPTNTAYSPLQLFPGLLPPTRPLTNVADPANKKSSPFNVDMLTQQRSTTTKQRQQQDPRLLHVDQFSVAAAAAAARTFPLPTWPSPHAFSDALRRYAETAAQQFQQWNNFKEAYMSSMEATTSSQQRHQQLVVSKPLNITPTTHHHPTYNKETAKILHRTSSTSSDIPSTSTSSRDNCKLMTSSSSSSGNLKNKFAASSSSTPSVADNNTSSSASVSPTRVRQPKTHRCVYCGKLYSRKYGLKIHIRTHTGYKPLKCKVCGRPFGDPSNLNKHVRLHAKGQTPYKCDLCGKVLVRRRDLDRHMKSRHTANGCGADSGDQSPSSHSSPPYWSMEKNATSSCSDVIMEADSS